MFLELLYPRQVVLVTAASSEKTNITSVEWVMPICEKPPMLALSLSNSSFTLDLLCTSMEFVVAVPTEKMREAVLLCGSTSGKYIDKFEESKMTQARAKRVSAPLVLEAAMNIECRVLSYASAGDHTLVVGEVLEVHGGKDEKGEALLFNRGGKKLFGFKAD